MAVQAPVKRKVIGSNPILRAMGWRSELEDILTVQCRGCGFETIDWENGNRRKYSRKQCDKCGFDPQGDD